MVRCTFSPARAWRLAVGPASTRTLGFIILVLRYSSRKCGLRRKLEQPRGAVAIGPLHDAWTRNPKPRSDMTARNRTESPHRSAMLSTPEYCQRFAGSISCQSVFCRESVRRQPPPAGHGLRSASAVAARKSSSRRLATRRAPGTLICRNLCAPLNLCRKRLKPNPSFKLSPNGGSRWPSSAGPAAHFALAVQHAPPSGPA